MGFDSLRERMVYEQIEARGVSDPLVIRSMKKVPRHLFVPKDRQIESYGDYPLSIGEGQTISQPYIVASMTELALLKSSDVVLDVGTGSGYAAAVLAECVKEVYTIETIAPLLERAEQIFQQLDYTNIHSMCGDGSLGWPDKSVLFDAIIVTAAAPDIPEVLFDQLKEGGRLIIPIGGLTHQILKRVTRLKGGEKKSESIEYVRFVPLIGEEGW